MITKDTNKWIYYWKKKKENKNRRYAVISSEKLREESLLGLNLQNTQEIPREGMKLTVRNHSLEEKKFCAKRLMIRVSCPNPSVITFAILFLTRLLLKREIEWDVEYIFLDC